MSLDRHIANKNAATITIQGLRPNLGNKKVFNRNPVPTDIVLATEEAIRKWDILLVRRRPMAAGRMIKEPVRSEPMNRNPNQYGQTEEQQEAEIDAAHVHSCRSRQVGREQSQHAAPKRRSGCQYFR